MKKVLLYCFTFLLLLQCQSPIEETNPLVFKVNTFDVPNNQMEVLFSIQNQTQEVWEGGAWSLHWNQFFGSIKPESLPEGMSIKPTQNSQYWVLNFGEEYSLNPGEQLEFSVLQSDIMTRLVMGPVGFFVHNAKTDHSFDLAHTVLWKDAQGLENLNIPTAADRYSTYEGIEPLAKEALHWIVPTPQKMEFKEGNYPLTETLRLNFGSFEVDRAFLSKQLQKGLRLKIALEQSAEAEIQLRKNPSLAEEAYQLNATADEIEIQAAGTKGLFYGLQSLHQLLLVAEREGNGIPLVSIEDAPRFQNRGFMMDLARNFYPKEKIIQILDYMAFYKLNLLDLRLSDDEGWRIEIEGLPELTDIGGKRGFTHDESDRLFPMYGSGSGENPNSGTGFLSREDYIEILKEAKLRQIDVVPQISFPSHARAAIVGMKNRYDNFLKAGDEEAANEFRLHDPEDESEYTSAQLFHDNTICICDPSSERFFIKVFEEIKALYTSATVPMKTFNIGADELPYGVWRKSPICDAYLQEHPQIDSYQSLYDANVKRINQIISQGGAEMAGWEDVLLVHSEKSQSEIEVNQNLKDLNFIPYVWNNIWGAGREDMIYRLNNLGFKAIMSNSAAFYFDMTDDKDMENTGLNWSGFVNYKDSWGTEPLNVFANKVKLQQLGITDAEVATKEQILPEALPNFLGIQSQLWTETATSEELFDRMLMPNMIVFAQRAWGPKETWLEQPTAEAQLPLLNASWNSLVNTIGQRQLPIATLALGQLAFDLPKPGAVIEDGELKVRQQFPGLSVHYTLDGSMPSTKDPLYTEAIKVSESATVTLRTFDEHGRGGNSIQIN